MYPANTKPKKADIAVLLIIKESIDQEKTANCRVICTHNQYKAKLEGTKMDKSTTTVRSLNTPLSIADRIRKQKISEAEDLNNTISKFNTSRYLAIYFIYIHSVCIYITYIKNTTQQ